MYPKNEEFDEELQELAKIAKALSHPARLAIIKYLAEQKSCISGNISDFIPLSRTTVSQHLQELKKAGLIKGTIDGLKVNYCICNSNMNKVKKMFNNFFKETVLSNKDNIC